MKKRKKNSFMSRLATFIFLTLAALAISTVGLTLARYYMVRSRTAAAVAKPYFFSSDMLTHGESPHHRIDGTGGQTESIVFTLKNYIDDLRCNDDAIEFVSTAKNENGDVLDEVSGIILGGAKHEVTVELDIDSSHFESDAVVLVTATVSEPYMQQLTARYSAQGVTAELVKSLITDENAIILTIGGGNDQSINVTWPAGLVPDASSPLFSEAEGNSTTFTAFKGSEYALVFFNPFPELDYELDEFTIR